MLDWLVTFLGSPPADLLRLVAVPVFGWAAYRDVRTRRVPNRVWLPLAVAGIALLLWDVWTVAAGDPLGGAAAREFFFVRVALSLGLVAPVGYLFYWFGGFGGADAKALIVLAVLFPTFPTYYLPTTALPLTETTVGVFSLTVLTNTVVVGAAYPLAVAARNAATGHVGRAMFLGKPVPAGDVTGAYGSLLETPEGFTRRGLDLDALRMYLRWRGCSLAEIRADPDAYRDPASLPARPNPPGDGAVHRADEGPVAGDSDGGAVADDAGDAGAADGSDDGSVADGHGDAGTAANGPARAGRGSEADDGRLDVADDDPWGAEAFVADIEGDAYGTTPETLREGLEVLVAVDVVWVSPGIPFIVPMFAGLLVSLVYGDLLVSAISAVT